MGGSLVQLARDPVSLWFVAFIFKQGHDVFPGLSCFPAGLCDGALKHVGAGSAPSCGYDLAAFPQHLTNGRVPPHSNGMRLVLYCLRI